MDRVKTRFRSLLSIHITILLLAVSGCTDRKQTDIAKHYASAELPTPVFNIPDFPEIFGGYDGKTIRMTSCRQIRELEFIALPKTVFRIEDTVKYGKTTIYKVTTDDYPSKKELFIDSRFVKTLEKQPPERPRPLPSKQTIIENLMSVEGSAYVWGGNLREDIPEMLSFYPPSSNISPELQNRWILKGVDCSGLLYEATNGYTPRNTDALISFGGPVQLSGLTIPQIIEKVEPLDLIIWEGHVIIILDKDKVIESRLDYDKEKPGCQGGVRIRPLKEVLEETMRYRMPADKNDDAKEGEKIFVIGRWYPMK